MALEPAAQTTLLERLERALFSAHGRAGESLEQIFTTQQAWREHRSTVIEPSIAAVQRVLRTNLQMELESGTGRDLSQDAQDVVDQSRYVVTLLADSQDQRRRIRNSLEATTQALIAVGEDLAGAEALISVGGGDQAQLNYVQAIRGRVSEALHELRSAENSLRDVDGYLGAAQAYLSGPIAASPEAARSLAVGAEVRLEDAYRETERTINTSLRDTHSGVDVIRVQVGAAEDEVTRSLQDLTEEVEQGMSELRTNPTSPSRFRSERFGRNHKPDGPSRSR